MSNVLDFDPRPKLLCREDIPDALALCRFAGWNQTQQDWMRFLRLSPESCFGVAHNQTCIATCISVAYAARQAWIGMMLVHPDYRRRGLAKLLLSHSIEHLEGEGIACVRLDATPDGRLVYEKMGFVAEFELSRWRLDEPPVAPQGMRQFSSQPNRSHREYLELDRRAFGCDRALLLDALADDSIVYSVDGGFGMVRSGHLANYLGPLTASNPEAARDIACRLLSDTSAPIFWDIPDSQAKTVEFARSLGFKQARTLTRMRRGENVAQDVELIHGISGPSSG